MSPRMSDPNFKIRKFYKYKSLKNMEHVLDIVLNDHLYCERWDRLNDPMEAVYSIYAESESDKKMMDDKIKKDLDTWRVTALATSNKNFLLWSHYADGHRGIAIEIEFPQDFSPIRVRYDWTTRVFSHIEQTEYRMRHLLMYKRPEWKYEKEYRIITEEEYFNLKNPIIEHPIKRIFVGARADKRQVATLNKALRDKAALVRMTLDEDGSMKIAKNT